jgi:hypothetical protein
MKKIVTILIVALMTIAGAFAQPAEHTYRNLTEGDVARLLDGLKITDLKTLESNTPAWSMHWYGTRLDYNEDTAFFEAIDDGDYFILDYFGTYDLDGDATITYGLYETSNGDVRYLLALSCPATFYRVWSISVDDLSKVLNYLMYADMIKATDKSDNPDVRNYIELCRNSVGL